MGNVARPPVAVSPFLVLVLAFSLFFPVHGAITVPSATGLLGGEVSGAGISVIAPERPSAPPDQPLGRVPAPWAPAPSAARRVRPSGRRAARGTAGVRATVSLRAPPGPV